MLKLPDAIDNTGQEKYPNTDSTLSLPEQAVEIPLEKGEAEFYCTMSAASLRASSGVAIFPSALAS